MAICVNCLQYSGAETTCPGCGQSMAFKSHPSALPIGTLLYVDGQHPKGRYHLGPCLGAGGFGITYLGYDKALECPVAIKEYFPGKIASRGNGNMVTPNTNDSMENYQYGLENFKKEAVVVAKFNNHRNIITILFSFAQNGTAYYVMPYIKGETLEERIVKMRRPMPEAELLSIMDSVFNGLEAVHKADFLHRDVKPANIYLPDDGQPLLLDFGSARQAILNQEGSLSIFLTHGYAPLEQYGQAGKQGTYTDVYSCAATMYASLLGKVEGKRLQRPPSAENRSVQKVHLEELHRMTSGHVSKRTSLAISEGMALAPAKRPQTIREFRKLLGTGTVDPPPPPVTRNYDLLCVAGEYAGQRVPLSEEPVVVGKDPQRSMLVLPNSTISRVHCRFFMQNGIPYVSDMGSKNGTFLHDVERLAPHQPVALATGDTVNLVGQAVFQVVQSEVDEPPPPPPPVGGGHHHPPPEAADPSGQPWIKRLLRMVFTPHGRFNRAKYLGVVFGNAVLQAVLLLLITGQPAIDARIYRYMPDHIAALSIGVQIMCFFIGVMAAVKRFHDLGRPWWHIFFALIPLYNIWICIQIVFFKGNEGPNEYGPDMIGKPLV